MVKKARSKHNIAIGLNYHADKAGTPSISVKGANLSADEIVRLANRFGIPVVKKQELAKALGSLSIDQEIPRELFESVAIVLAQINKKVR